MFDKKIILKLAEHVFKRGQGYYDKQTMHPTREWLLGLFVATVIIVIGATFSARSFLLYQSVNTDGGEYQKAVVKYNQVLAKRMLDMYTQRKEHFLALQSSVHMQAPVATTTVEAQPTKVISTSTPQLDTAEEDKQNSGGGGILMAN